MTRRRFVKLAMAKGVSRNDANALADAYRTWYSYEDLFRKFVLCPSPLVDAFLRARSAVASLASAFQRIAEAVWAATRRWGT